MVSVLIVTFNSAAHLERCLESAMAQDCPVELVVVDNASTDSTRSILARYEARVRVLYNERNYGFAAAQNQAIRQACGEWLLVLNPDVVLRPDFISRLLAAARRDPQIGVVCGKLLRWKPVDGDAAGGAPHLPASGKSGAAEFTNIIDCAGMYFLPNLRHLDRGAEQPDHGQFEREEYVFGASGAAALYRRKMVEHVSIGGEFFDEAFFAYREDADLAWRAQLLGWRCLYTPRAVGWHVRRVTPERREQLPLAINWHSVKNRFLMRMKNTSPAFMSRLRGPVLWRDLMVCGYALVRDRNLLSALYAAWRQRGAMREKRRIIRRRQRVPDAALLPWFFREQAGVPLHSPQNAAPAMKIAIVGTRGIPARYGGFETLAERLATQLADRGHQVSVYCRRPYTTATDAVDPRVRRVILPGVRRKNLDTFINGLLAGVHVSFSDADVVLVCNVANSPFAWLPRLFGKPTALNVDGLDRTRRKWSLVARLYLHLCEMISVLTPTRIITDAQVIRAYYRQRYRKNSVVIGYGADAPEGTPDLRFALPRGQYILYVARLEKENNPELVLRAYGRIMTDWPLVIVGGNNYEPEYVARLKAMSAARVVFTGPVYGDGYWALQKHAGAFIFAGEVGGIHPALVEAMCSNNAVLYLATDANRETAGDSGIQFRDESELAERLTELVASPKMVREYAARAQARAQALYRWEYVADQYEQLFADMSGRAVRRAAPAAPEMESAA